MLDKERDLAFGCLKIACGNCVVHGSRPVLPNRVELLQLIRINFFDLVLELGQETFFFWVKG